MNLSVSKSNAPEPVLVPFQKSGNSSPIIKCTPDTPSIKMEVANKQDSGLKNKESLKAKKNANSIKKAKRSKAQKPNSAKKATVTSGNIKSILDFMSKPKARDVPEIKVEEPK